MKVTNPELAAIYRTEAARTTHKKWAETSADVGGTAGTDAD